MFRSSDRIDSVHVVLDGLDLFDLQAEGIAFARRIVPAPHSALLGKCGMDCIRVRQRKATMSVGALL